MGVMDKLLNMMKIGDDNEEEDYYSEEDDGYVEEKPQVKEKEPEKQPKTEEKFKSFERNPQQKKRRVTMNDSTVCVFKPKSSEEAKEICETLLNDNTVVLNFEGVDIPTSQRVLDIVTGACIAIGGRIQKISNFIFIATPASVDVSGEFQDDLTGSFDSI
ncbi:MAG: cell division protein SepF [Lachnospiraceae bacterium]|jgi:cell division inhibitor SepF|nr:cell division protein SepF [Lachnospiraceae bacterium]